MILITGATGTSGQSIVKNVLARGGQVRVLARDPAKAATLLGDEIEITRGDLDDPQSAEAAMDGVERALLLSPPSNTLVEMERGFVDAAKRARVRHIVKFSAYGASPEAAPGFLKWHGASEKYLRESGIAWTMLRPAFFMPNLLGLAPMVVAGTIQQPAGDGKAGFVDVRDIGAVAASALLEDGHAGKSYEITGPQLLSFHDIAALLSRVLGRKIAYVDIDAAQAKKSLLATGLPEWRVDGVVQLFVELKEGKFARLTDVVEKIGQKTPTTMEAFVLEHAKAFRAA